MFINLGNKIFFKHLLLISLHKINNRLFTNRNLESSFTIHYYL